MGGPDLNYQREAARFRLPLEGGTSSSNEEGEAPSEEGPGDITDWFIPPHYRADAQMYRRARILVRSAPLFWGVSLFFVTVFALQGTLPPSAAPGVMVGATLVLVTPLVLKFTTSHYFTANLLLVEIVFGIAFQAAIDAGIRDPSLLIILVVPWLAALLLGPSGGIIWSGIVTLVFASFYTLHQYGFPIPDHSSQETHWWFQLIFGSAVTMLVGSMGWLYERSRRRLINQVSREYLARQKETSTILFGVAIPLFLVDDDFRLLFANEQGEDLLKEGLGKQHQGKWEFSSEFAALFKGKIENMRRRQEDDSSKAQHAEVFLQSVDAHFEAYITFYDDRFVVCLAKAFHRRHAEKLTRAKEQAEAEVRRRTSRFDKMRRQIRASVTDILGLSSALSADLVETCSTDVATTLERRKERSPGHDQRELVEDYRNHIVERASAALKTLDAASELNWLENTDVELKPQRVDVRSEAEQVLKKLFPVAKRKELALWIGSNSDQIEIVTDRGFLKRMLTMLIGNALSNTDRGNLMVEVGREEHAATVHVEDTEGGSEMTDRLLKKITRGESSRGGRVPPDLEGAARYESELKVATAKRLVILLDGTLDLKNTSETDNSFSVTIPSLELDRA